MTPPPPEVKALFRAPFRTCPMDRFVMSECGNMAASTEDDEEFYPDGEFMAPRGWGRTSYTKGAGPTHDAWWWSRTLGSTSAPATGSPSSSACSERCSSCTTSGRRMATWRLPRTSKHGTRSQVRISAWR